LIACVFPPRKTAAALPKIRGRFVDDRLDDFVGNVGTATTNVATVTIAPVNDAPIAVGGTLAAIEDTLATTTLAAVDVDGDLLTFSIVTPPERRRGRGARRNDRMGI
jgi:hypothetical protein